MRNSPASDNQSVDFEALVQSIERSPVVAPADAADALRRVLGGVITGEGPTTLGRAHFSRTLDSIDAGLCARILIASGGDRSIPVSREEAELLIDIDAAAAERTDGGQFDILFAKAITHCVQAAVGQPVPPRHVALSPDTPLSSWAAPVAADADHEVMQWIVSEAKTRKRPNGTLMAIAAFLAGAAVSPITQSVVGVIDLGA
jgi:hypothetical protein